MITRVIEARPEELRVFLEEAAGVSKYRERRKETESRLRDSRDNLARVEDIRSELGAQLAKLEAQAEIATRYREHEAGLKRAQHLLWFAKQQDAARQRERHAAEIANLAAGFEALQAELRAAENRVETLRADQYRAGDLLHEKQGAFYAANAEVTRLEQQLQFARESEGRLSQQAAQIAELLTGLNAQIAAVDAESRDGEDELATALARREALAGEEPRCRPHSAGRGDPRPRHAPAEVQQQISDINRRYASPRRARKRGENALRSRSDASASTPKRGPRCAAPRRSRWSPSSSSRKPPTWPAGRRASPDCTTRCRRCRSDNGRRAISGRASRTLADRGPGRKRSSAQTKIGRNKDADDWLAARSSVRRAGCGSNSTSNADGRTR
jgi:chromosome segregation ATPase